MSLLILSICNISMFINVLGAKITSTIRNKKSAINIPKGQGSHSGQQFGKLIKSNLADHRK